MAQYLDELASIYGQENQFYQENIIMLEWYAKRMISTIQNRQYKSFLSLGIGFTITTKSFVDNLHSMLENYWIVEGSNNVIEEFTARLSLPANVHIVNELFERFLPEQPVDGIEMGFVLEHVDDPLSLLQKYAKFLKPGGSIFIAVPNANSLHRQVGVEAGLLNSIYNLGKEDLASGHQRYFDMQSLTQLVDEAGLTIANSEGLFLKPIATSQMKALDLSPQVLQAFLKVGLKYPEIANCICLEVVV
jgi:SAM-dependent methyltransferase